MKTVLLISIWEKHARRIFTGKKRVELRKVRPRIVEGDLVIVYAPRPVSAVVGAFQVGGVIEAQPSQLWELVGNEAGVSRAEFDCYYSGARQGYGILVKRAWRLAQHLSLQVIRQIWCDFYPPQGYKYLTKNERQHLSTVLSRNDNSNRASSLHLRLSN